MNKGFTLIELMIVIAIIAIIAAIAIPNMLESRMQANETNAAAALRMYCAAQGIYSKGNYGINNGLPVKSYCLDFKNLGGANAHHKSKVSDKIDLIPPVFADSTIANGYNGYYFTNQTSPAITAWIYDYGLYADPCVYAKSGVNTFHVDAEGIVLMKDLGGVPSGGAVEFIDSTWVAP